jgi:hypothetical protein
LTPHGLNDKNAAGVLISSDNIVTLGGTGNDFSPSNGSMMSSPMKKKQIQTFYNVSPSSGKNHDYLFALKHQESLSDKAIPQENMNYSLDCLVKQFSSDIIQERIDIIRRAMKTQRTAIVNNLKELYDEQWGIKKELDYSDLTNVNTSPEEFFHEKVMDSYSNHFQSNAKQYQSIKKKFEALNSTSSGLELMHYFIIDLLGQKTKSAIIFKNKFNEDFEKMKIVSIYLKFFSVFFVFALNAFFIYFILLKAVQKGFDWQLQFLQVVLTQFAIEIFIFETIEVLWIHYVVPESVRIDVKKAIYVLEVIAANVETLLLKEKNPKNLQETNDNLVGLSPSTKMKKLEGSLARSSSFLKVPGIHNEEKKFDSTNYLFISKQLAELKPDLIESRIIQAYHNQFPGMICYTWPHYQEILQEKMRNQAIAAAGGHHHHQHGQVDEHGNLIGEGGLSSKMMTYFEETTNTIRTRGSFLYIFVSTIASGLLFILQSFGVLPFIYQRIIIRAAQTSVLSGLTMVWYTAKKHSGYFAIFVGVVIVLTVFIGIRTFFKPKEEEKVSNLLDQKFQEIREEVIAKSAKHSQRSGKSHQQPHRRASSSSLQFPFFSSNGQHSNQIMDESVFVNAPPPGMEGYVAEQDLKRQLSHHLMPKPEEDDALAILNDPVDGKRRVKPRHSMEFDPFVESTLLPQENNDVSPFSDSLKQQRRRGGGRPGEEGLIDLEGEEDEEFFNSTNYLLNANSSDVAAHADFLAVPPNTRAGSTISSKKIKKTSSLLGSPSSFFPSSWSSKKQSGPPPAATSSSAPAAAAAASELEVHLASPRDQQQQPSGPQLSEIYPDRADGRLQIQTNNIAKSKSPLGSGGGLKPLTFSEHPSPVGSGGVNEGGEEMAAKDSPLLRSLDSALYPNYNNRSSGASLHVATGNNHNNNNEGGNGLTISPPSSPVRNHSQGGAAAAGGFGVPSPDSNLRYGIRLSPLYAKQRSRQSKTRKSGEGGGGGFTAPARYPVRRASAKPNDDGDDDDEFKLDDEGSFKFDDHDEPLPSAAWGDKKKDRHDGDDDDSNDANRFAEMRL